MNLGEFYFITTQTISYPYEIIGSEIKYINIYRWPKDPRIDINVMDSNKYGKIYDLRKSKIIQSESTLFKLRRYLIRAIFDYYVR